MTSAFAPPDSDTTVPWNVTILPVGEVTPSSDPYTTKEDVWLSLGAKPKSQACSTPQPSSLMKSGK